MFKVFYSKKMSHFYYVSEKSPCLYLYSKKLYKVFYSNFFLKIKSCNLFHLDMKYSPHNFLISNNLFAKLNNI